MPFFTFYSSSFWAVLAPSHLIAFLSFLALANSQLTNGRFFTNGLSIINAPQIQSQFHAGANIPISIEVSGDGKVPLAGTQPNSGLPTRFDLLEIFLVSSAANVNLTVTAGSSLLAGETGSVRHFDFDIPDCLPGGAYNLTFYETSLLDNDPIFAITPIAIIIQNNNPSDPSCASDIQNPLQVQPQPDRSFPGSPFFIPDAFPTQTSFPPQASSPTQTSSPSRMLTSTTPLGPFPTTTQVVTATVTQAEATFTAGGNFGFIPVNGSMGSSPGTSHLLLLANIVIFFFYGPVVFVA